MEEEEPKEETKLLRQFEGGTDWKKTVFSALVVLLIIASGIVSGFFLSRKEAFSGKTETKKLNGEAEMISGPGEMGIKDERVFRDDAKGKIEVNDFSQVREGSHKLLRPWGESQTAYLTSSVIDLDQFVGKCVQVWGETFAGQEAGWLMDVGRVKTLNKCPEGL
jgi:hypothetical protein